MYCTDIFRESIQEKLQGLIRSYPLGTLITTGAGGLLANMIPLYFVQEGQHGLLRAHLPKKSDQIDALRTGGEVLVVFQGPQGYVTPSWYPSKAEHGKVVPTWNYTTVQVTGTPTLIEDRNWLLNQLETLTNLQESSRPTPWKVSDAPSDFIDGMLNAIIGLEIRITSLEGKVKTSQNRPEADRIGVCEGFLNERGDKMMSDLVAGTLPK